MHGISLTEPKGVDEGVSQGSSQSSYTAGPRGSDNGCESQLKVNVEASPNAEVKNHNINEHTEQDEENGTYLMDYDADQLCLVTAEAMEVSVEVVQDHTTEKVLRNIFDRSNNIATTAEPGYLETKAHEMPGYYEYGR